MGSEILLISLIAFASILTYIFLNIKTEDSISRLIFQVLGIGFVVVIALFLPKIALDEQNYCVVVAENATIAGSTTNYDYTRVCFDNNSGTANLFYEVVLWVFRSLAAFMMVYLFYYLFTRIKGSRK
ncbi:MAG: hypothetical protein ACTSYG_07570 [Candidatus Heimdallarchaeota archaeon]